MADESTKESVEKVVIAIVSDIVGVAQHRITRGSHLFDDLGADSLDMVEIVIELEDDYQISIDNDVAEKIGTVGQLVDCVVSLANGAGTLFERGEA